MEKYQPALRGRFFVGQMNEFVDKIKLSDNVLINQSYFIYQKNIFMKSGTQPQITSIPGITFTGGFYSGIYSADIQIGDSPILKRVCIGIHQKKENVEDSEEQKWGPPKISFCYNYFGSFCLIPLENFLWKNEEIVIHGFTRRDDIPLITSPVIAGNLISKDLVTFKE